MKQSTRHRFRAILAGISLFCPLWTSPARSGPTAAPRIDRIDPFLQDLVLIHFDTEPNRSYDLQFSDESDPLQASWISLYTAPNIPFPSHYVVPDSRTHPRRFYRLKVTP